MDIRTGAPSLFDIERILLSEEIYRPYAHDSARIRLVGSIEGLYGNEDLIRAGMEAP